ncbi:class I SAM-dependent methyltransferase [Labedaea rhizosphaerae]|uniref:Methyltransferase family protein n=1 Tax=Labedaea rhizosphaerae TaxID=598644 RepID=A0A4V3D039_LABRH|nr:class I SAM-dependent methyltransferase [Labedaea rhizosphaerae]TDQ04305.1 methyltransferase family protein [Labedaea rhizosphaerae]
MPDAIFDDPRLARIYDDFDGPRHDLDAYVAIVEELGARHVLDVGCGTGNLALILAERELMVDAVDPALASLEVARSKRGAHWVAWHHGDARDLPPVGADLAVMTGNVAQVFLTDEDWASVLRSIRAALRPGGHLVFETRRPEFRAWEQWSADPAEVTIAGVTQHREVTEVRLPLVSFRYTYTFADGTVVTSDSTLRFRSRDEVEASLAEQGYRVLDVRQAPDRPGREFVFIATAES